MMIIRLCSMTMSVYTVCVFIIALQTFKSVYLATVDEKADIDSVDSPICAYESFIRMRAWIH
jgi:hypothetical protein